MKLKILKDHDLELSPAKTMALKKGSEPNLSQDIADMVLALDGVAEKLQVTTPEKPGAKPTKPAKTEG